MSAQFLQAGFGLANYLQSALSPGPVRGGDVLGEFEQPLDRQAQPPAMIRSLIDSARVYFRLSHQNAINNLICVLMPVGKVRHLVPDLYIPAVSLYTFLLLRSLYVIPLREIRPHLNDVLARTLTRISLVFTAEFILLTALVYLTSPSSPSLDGASTGSPRPSSYLQGSSSMTAGTKQFGNGLGEQTNDAMNPFSKSLTGSTTAPTGQMSATYLGGSSSFVKLDTTQSQYGVMSQPATNPFGTPSPVIDSVANSDAAIFKGATKYFGEHMTMPLTGRSPLRLAQKIFIIGYKYVLLNCYILTVMIAPIRSVTLFMAFYVSVCSLLFSLRMIVSLNSGEDGKPNPLMFVFPVLQPVFCYILLPHA
ncbi:uncharacterized protein BXIN_0612 [Babesia sp. Xinjiang]|uniref:uncharacterized protein n=1 Tax=Babesia sp. Xinjiang TaxID=462227 RepID=UPI000A2513AE|nr:uncharacterized protein BXIN_0612 [Babesia sp. Xinjiang]ORM41796.1 hypothetical protein BXIN_0612 [Babesia sp. Xinjiang]